MTIENQAPTPEKVPLVRLLSTWLGVYDHLYTTSAAEISIPGGIYKNEGTAALILPTYKSGSVPLYRCKIGNDHFYTTNLDEYEKAIDGGAQFQHHVGYVYPEKVGDTVPFYRYFSHQVHDHFYTTDTTEVQSEALKNNAYVFESIAGYVFPAPK